LWGNTLTTDIINQFSRAPNSKLRVLKPERGIQREGSAREAWENPQPILCDCKAVLTSTDFGRGWPHPELLQGELPQQLAESFQHGGLGPGGV